MGKIPKARIFLILLWVVCGSIFSQNARSASPLRLGMGAWAGYQPFYLAKDIGLFKDNSVKLISLTSNAETLRAFQSGAIDAAALTLDEALQLAENEINVRAVLVIDFSQGADVILAKPEFKTLPELKGKKVGVESTALGAYILSRALELNGMNPTDVQIVPLEVAQHEEAFRNGLIDAVSTYEPAKTKLVSAGANVVFDSSRIPGEVVDVLIIREDYAREHRKEITTLVNAWFQALDFLQKNPNEASQKMSQRLKITPQESLASFEGMKMPSRTENRDLFAGSPSSLSTTGQKLMQLMLDHKFLSKTVDVNKIFRNDLFENS